MTETDSAGTSTSEVFTGQTMSLNGGASAVATRSVAIATASTTTALASSVNPAVVDQQVTFTATVTGSSPTGTVTFFDSSVTLARAALDGSGRATFTTSKLVVGSHAITASYGGDGANAPSTSPALRETVNSSPATPPTTTAPTSPATMTTSIKPSPATIGALTTFFDSIADPMRDRPAMGGG